MRAKAKELKVPVSLVSIYEMEVRAMFERVWITHTTITTIQKLDMLMY